MPTRTARTAWNGTLEQGSGQVELSSSKIGTDDVGFPERAADRQQGAERHHHHVGRRPRVRSVRLVRNMENA